MAHKEQHQFFEQVKELYPDSFKEKEVLDCGSLDINGSLEDLFEDCNYTGIDIVRGLNVHFVTTVHEAPFENETFDTIVSAEMLEHDEYWKLSLQKIYDFCKSGGLIAISCAGKDRPEHGTPNSTGTEWGTSSDYYMNLEPRHFQEIFKDDMFISCEYRENAESHDTYFFGFKK